MNKELIYNTIIVSLKKFYTIDYAINFLIDLDVAQQYINEPYIQPMLKEIYNQYKNDTNFTTKQVLKPYMQQLANKIATAEDDMTITTYDYEYLKYVGKVLKNNDLNFAYYLTQQQLTSEQEMAIRKHHVVLKDDEFCL